MPRKLDLCCREAVRELHEAVQRRQLLDVVGHDKVLHFLAWCDRRSVARVVVAVAICLIHLAHFAAADEVGATLRRLDVGGGKDQLGSCEGAQVDGAVLAIGFGQFAERVDPQHERAADRACGLQPVLDSRQSMECVNLVEKEPRPYVPSTAEAEQCVDGKVHPKRQERPVEHKIGMGRGDEQDGSLRRLPGPSSG